MSILTEPSNVKFYDDEAVGSICRLPMLFWGSSYVPKIMIGFIVPGGEDVIPVLNGMCNAWNGAFGNVVSLINQEEVLRMKLIKVSTVVLTVLAMSAVAMAATLDEVKQRGHIKAGVN